MGTKYTAACLQHVQSRSKIATLNDHIKPNRLQRHSLSQQIDMIP
jgi:hypothetical protein